MTLQPFISLYQYALTPLEPFSWFGLKISSLDLAAAFRLCYILRYLKENLRGEHTKRRETDSTLPPPEDRSFVRDAFTVLTVVYGGEAIAGTPTLPIDISTSPRHSPDPHTGSSPTRRPYLLHDLRRRATAVHPRSGVRPRTPRGAADGVPLGAPALLFGRPHPRNARVHARPARRAPQPIPRSVRVPLGAPPRLLCAYARSLSSLLLMLPRVATRSSPTVDPLSLTSSPSSTRPPSRSPPPPNSSHTAGRRPICGAPRSSRPSTPRSRTPSLFGRMCTPSSRACSVAQWVRTKSPRWTPRRRGRRVRSCSSPCFLRVRPPSLGGRPNEVGAFASCATGRCGVLTFGRLGVVEKIKTN